MAKQQKKSNWTKRDKMKKRIRKKISGSAARPRISVFRSGRHIYAQVISDETGETIAYASSKEEAVMSKAGSDALELSHNDSKSTKSIAAAIAVGTVVAERAKEKGVERAVFDRNGFLYHGRIKAVAEGARAGGLVF